MHGLLGPNDVLAYLVMMTPAWWSCTGPQVHGFAVPALRPNCIPLLEGGHGRHLRAETVSERDYVETNDCSQRPQRFGRIGDRLLYYSKTPTKTFNRVAGEFSTEQLARYKYEDKGGPYKAENLTAPHFSETRTVEWRGVHPGADRQWRFGMDELDRLYEEGRILLRRDGKPRKDGLKEYLDPALGPALQDIWTDIQLGPTDKERLGYPTQKPIALLERIIASSSNEGDVVLDPFCGCGTAVDAAQKLGRKWVGIDVT